MEEIWKDIAGYEGRYQVSTLGRVRNSKTARICKPSKCGGSRNYLHVTLYQGSHDSRKSVSIHRLVADAFIPNPDNLPEVNHIDGNGFNNVVSNLEWITHAENMIHASKVLGKRVACCETFAKPIIRVEDGQIFNSITEAAKACGMKTGACISHCLNGRPYHNTAGGYHWKYADAATL